MTMMWVGIGSSVLGAASTAYAANKNAKALKGAQGQPLDISKVISDAREQAAANLGNSIALENQFRPGTAALRTSVDNSLGGLAGGNTPGLLARDSLLSSISEPFATSTGSNPLLEASANSILENLKLGGTLGRDVQQQAAKAALEKGGAAGISGSGAVRGLVARDLGLTSLGLLQQRQNQALTAGSAIEDMKIKADQARLNDFLGRIGAASGAAGQDVQRTGLLASIIDGRAMPESGLSPGSIASLYVGDKNAQDQIRMDAAAAGAASRNQNLNSLLGFGAMGLAAYNKGKGKGGTDGPSDPSNPFDS